MSMNAVAGLLVAVWAQAAPVTPISFRAARSLAQRDAPAVRVALGREAVGVASVSAAGALANPTLALTTARETARLSAGLTVPLPLFGQRGTAIDAAEADLASVKLDTEVSRLEARSDASLAWIDLWEAQQRAHWLSAAADDAVRLVGVTKERFDAGSAPKVDWVRAQADRARAEAESNQARTTTGANRARLSIWLPAETVAPEATGEIEFGALPPLAQLESSLEGHPQVTRDHSAVNAAAMHVRAEKRLRFPVIDGLITVNAGDPTLPGTDVIGGLSFELPVLSQRGGAIDRAQAEQAVAALTEENSRRQLLVSVRDAYQRAEGAASGAQALGTEVVPAMVQAREMTEEAYRDGRIDVLRLLDAQRALTEARLSWVAAQATFGRAMVELERASGVALGGER